MSLIAASTSLLSDREVVHRIRNGDPALFEVLMRRHNQRIYRAVRAIVKDETEAEDVMQQAYINAFTHLQQFQERSEFVTWLMRIALNEAFARRHKLHAAQAVAAFDEFDGALMDTSSAPPPDPERQAYAQELRQLLESAIDELPEGYRAVFMLRDVEGLSTNETAEGLGLGEEAVKTRLHRARAMIRRSVTARLGGAAAEAFQFPATRCDRVVAFVLERIAG